MKPKEASAIDLYDRLDTMDEARAAQPEKDFSSLRGTAMDDEETTWKNRYARVEPFMDRVLLWVVNSQWSLAVVVIVLAAAFGLGIRIGWWLA